MTTPTTIDTRDELVIAGGPRFHYRAWGDSSAPTVLLLHGLTGNAWEWDPIAAVLARRFHVLAFNQRGHGASAWASDYAAERMVDDLTRVTAALGLESVGLVGHSMGALNGFLFAARHPVLVKRLVIVDFGPDSMSPAARTEWSAYLRAAGQATYSDPREALAEWHAANPRARERELLPSSHTTSPRARTAAGVGGSMPPASKASSSRRRVEQRSGPPSAVWPAPPWCFAGSTAEC